MVIARPSAARSAEDNDTSSALPLAEAQRNQILRLAIRLMVGGALLAAAALALFVPDQGARQISTLVTLLTAGGALYLLYKRSAAIANTAMIWLFWATIMLTALLNGGLNAPLIAALPGLAAMSHLLAGRRSTQTLIVLSILACIALAFAEVLHLLPPAPPPPVLWRAAVLALLTLIYGSVAGQLVASVNAHHRQSGALASELSELLVQTSQRELDLQANNQQHQMLMHAQALAGIGLFVVEKYRFSYANEALCRLTGYTADELCALPSFLEIVHPTHRLRVADFHAARLRGEIVEQRYDLAIITRRGETRDIELTVMLETGEHTPRLLGTVLDITARKNVERELQQSREMFSHAFASSPLAISITRLSDGKVFDVNNAYAELIDWPRETLLGRKLVEFGIWPNLDERRRWSEALLRERRLKDYPVSSSTRGGKPLLVTTTAEIIDIAGEECVLTFVTDLTQLRAAEAELRQSEERFGRVFRASPIATVITRLADGAYIDVNAAFTRLLGWSREEALQGSTISLGVWESLSEREAWVARVTQAGSVRDEEVRLRAKNGEARLCLLSAETVEFAHEQCLISMMFDISDRLRAEQEIRQLANELEQRVQARTAELTDVNRELESFAYSISHDLRAPLRGIDGFSRLLQEDYGEAIDARGQEYLMRVRRAAQRMGTLIDDLLELSRVSRQEMRRERVDLSALARDIIAGKTIEEPERQVAVTIGDDCFAEGDPQLLRVLLENLIDNAWKYSRHVANADIRFGCETDAEGNTVFCVSDNGAGFDMTYVEKLFAPFQRLHTPSEFEGSGIGLASASRVVRRHGGRIWGEGSPGHGAIFRFTLAPPK